MNRLFGLTAGPLSGLALCLSGFAVLAQEVGDCDWRANAQVLAEPWEQSTRTFANGAVRLALLDTVEPAAGAFHVLVLSPPYDELGERQCRVVSYQGGSGYAALDFANLQAGYDPAYGLVFTLPGQVFDPNSGATRPSFLNFTLNQSTGGIEVWGE